MSCNIERVIIHISCKWNACSLVTSVICIIQFLETATNILNARCLSFTTLSSTSEATMQHWSAVVPAFLIGATSYFLYTYLYVIYHIQKAIRANKYLYTYWNPCNCLQSSGFYTIKPELYDLQVASNFKMMKLKFILFFMPSIFMYTCVYIFFSISFCITRHTKLRIVV